MNRGTEGGMGRQKKKKVVIVAMTGNDFREASQSGLIDFYNLIN